MHHGHKQSRNRRLCHGFCRFENDRNQLMNTVAEPLRGLRNTGLLVIHPLPQPGQLVEAVQGAGDVPEQWAADRMGGELRTSSIIMYTTYV